MEFLRTLRQPGVPFPVALHASDYCAEAISYPVLSVLTRVSVHPEWMPWRARDIFAALTAPGTHPFAGVVPYLGRRAVTDGVENVLKYVEASPHMQMIVPLLVKMILEPVGMLSTVLRAQSTNRGLPPVLSFRENCKGQDLWIMALQIVALAGVTSYMVYAESQDQEEEGESEHHRQGLPDGEERVWSDLQHLYDATHTVVRRHDR
jgi:hypothetical protein